MRSHALIWATALLGLAAPAVAQPEPAPPRMLQTNPYQPYEWLIGDWYSKPAAGPDVAIRQRFSWGPGKSYILYTTLTRERNAPEKVHFEGIMVWNGQTKALDYVFAIEPGTGGQEKGTVTAQPDGSVVRDVLLTSANGQTGRFRQRFWREGDGAATSLMRQTDSGWVNNFPGSDRILMARTPPQGS